jgi:hypothetical protein
MQHGCGAEDAGLMGSPHPARKTRKRVLNELLLHEIFLNLVQDECFMVK